MGLNVENLGFRVLDLRFGVWGVRLTASRRSRSLTTPSSADMIMLDTFDRFRRWRVGVLGSPSLLGCDEHRPRPSRMSSRVRFWVEGDEFNVEGSGVEG